MAKKLPPNFDSEPGPVLHTARWRFGGFVLDERKRELSLDGRNIALEPKPLNMLMLMLRHPGELITKNDLMEALWTGRIVTDAVLTNCATKLRNALAEHPQGAALRNVHGYGYRLDAAPVLEEEQPSPGLAPKLSEGLAVPQREHWRLEQRLGQSGETWRARHLATGDERVFKFATTPRELSALKREVTLYRLLRQSFEGQLLPLLDWQFDEPPWYLELPYCPLGSLQEYLQTLGGPQAVPLARRIEWIAQLAETVGQIHSVGIIHKDLKPSNILVTPKEGGGETLLLTDFGAGRVLDLARLEALAITRLGFTQQFTEGGSSGSSASSGTPLYYAPEVLAGQPATLRSDIYALGVICFQLVVGDMRRLFTPDWHAAIADPLLREDIALACANNPELRLGDAHDLARRLRCLPERRQEAEAKAAAEKQAAATALALERAEARRRGLQWAAIALAAGLVSSLALFWQARVARIAADQSAREAQSLSHFFLDDVLHDVSSGDRPAQHLTVQELLDAARDSTGGQFSSQARLRATVRLQLARAYSQLNLDTEARIQAEKALVDLAGLDGPEIVDDRADATAIVLDKAYGDGLLPDYLPRYEVLAEKLLSEMFPKSPHYRQLQWQLANAESDLGKYQSALKRINQMISQSADLAFIDPKTLAGMRLSRVRIMIGLEEFSDARSAVSEALPLLINALGAAHIQRGRALLMDAEAAIALGKFSDATDDIALAEPIVINWEKRPSSYTQLLVKMKALLALERHQPDSAELALSELDRIIAAGPEPSPTIAHVGLFFRARVAEQRHQFGQAISLAQLAIQAASQYMGPQNVKIIGMKLSLAEWQCQVKDIAGCKSSFESVSFSSLSGLPELHSFRVRYKNIQSQISPRLNRSNST